MNASNPVVQASGESLSRRLNIHSLLLVYSAAVLMMAMVYFVVSSVVINPHSASASDTPRLHSGDDAIQAKKLITAANNSGSIIRIDGPQAQVANQFIYQASGQIQDD